MIAITHPLARCSEIARGDLDDKEISIDVQAPKVGVEIMAPPGMEEMTSQLQNMFVDVTESLQAKNIDRQRSIQATH